jgi:hypothetical protein
MVLWGEEIMGTPLHATKKRDGKQSREEARTLALCSRIFTMEECDENPKILFPHKNDDFSP